MSQDNTYMCKICLVIKSEVRDQGKKQLSLSQSYML